MANHSYYRTSSAGISLVSHQVHHFNVVARELFSKNIVTQGSERFRFGSTCVIDWELWDAFKNNIVGQLQGQTIAADKSPKKFRNLSANLVFTDPRFEGSTLVVGGRLGYPSLHDKGDWSVVGGTGKFAGAQGNISYERVQVKKDTIMYLNIRVVCLIFTQQMQEPVRKVGPWGGEGGTYQKIKDVDKLPRRLESISIYADEVIESIAFSYTDQAGRKQTCGPWGGDHNKRAHRTIRLGPSETVTKINGSTGKYSGRTVVTSLTIVTNFNEYAYGKEINDDTPFRIVATNDQSIVGFFGRADGEAVCQIGAYVWPPN